MISVRSSILATLLLGAIGACASDNEFQCLEDSACSNDGIEGLCQPTGYCSFPDPDCESGYRYGELADAFAEQCVPVDDGSTGVPDATTTSPQTTAAADPVCGNGSVEDGEACDGDALDNESCVSRGFDGGTLACGEDCTFDDSGCHLCGDSMIGGDEACDGPELSGMSCADVDGFDGGMLGCQANCQLDVSACTSCGNDTREDGEACDGADLGAASCMSEGFVAGELGCTDACSLDTTACIPEGCGNGVVEDDEECEPGRGGLPTCAEQDPGTIGVTSCTPDCTIDATQCGTPATVATLAEGEVTSGATLTLMCEDGTASCQVPPAGMTASPDDLNAGCSIQCAEGTSALATAAPHPMSLNWPVNYRIQIGSTFPANPTDCESSEPCEATFAVTATPRTARFNFQAVGAPPLEPDGALVLE